MIIRSDIIDYLPKLNKNDYLEKDSEFWRDYRRTLTKILKEDVPKKDKTQKNIYDMSKEVGIKPTARYFNITPSQVRYYIKKHEKELNKNERN